MAAKFAITESLESRRLLSAAAVRLTDIQPGAEDSLALSSGEYVVAGGKFYFSAVDSHGQEPYVSDGTIAGSTLPWRRGKASRRIGHRQHLARSRLFAGRYDDGSARRPDPR